jgi:hypothetical protein
MRGVSGKAQWHYEFISYRLENLFQHPSEPLYLIYLPNVYS